MQMEVESNMKADTGMAHCDSMPASAFQSQKNAGLA